MTERAITPSERVLVPSGHNYRRLLKSAPVLLGALGPLLVVRNGPVSLIAAIVTALTLAGIVQAVSRTQRIVVTPERLECRRPIGLPRRRLRADIATVVSVRVSASAGGRAHRNLVLLDRDERLILRLKSPHWTPEDMRQLVGWLGVAPQELERPVTARKLAQRFPRAVPLSERYPFLTGVVTVVVLAGAIIAASAMLE